MNFILFCLVLFLLFVLMTNCGAAHYQRHGDMFPYSYLVVYKFQNKGTSGTGTMQLNRRFPIKGFADVDNVTEYVKQEGKLENVAIINWIKIKK